MWAPPPLRFALLTAVGCAAVVAKADTISVDALLPVARNNPQILPIRLDDGGNASGSVSGFDLSDISLSSPGPKAGKLFDDGDSGGAGGTEGGDSASTSLALNLRSGDSGSSGWDDGQTASSGSGDQLSSISLPGGMTATGADLIDDSDSTPPVPLPNGGAGVPTPLPSSAIAAALLLAAATIGRKQSRLAAR